MKRHDEHHVRLDDGTVWAVDRGDPTLEWLMRYGTVEDLVRVRMSVASVLASYKALIDKPQKRRNEIVTALRSALDEWDAATPHKSTDTKGPSDE